MAKWIVSLSDGTRLTDEQLQTDKSAWTNLKAMLERDPNKSIVQIQLIVNGQRYNSPSVSPKAKFQSNAIDNLFACRRKGVVFVGATPGRIEDEWISFSYRLNGYRHFFWVNQKTNETYIQVLDCSIPDLAGIEKAADIKCQVQ